MKALTLTIPWGLLIALGHKRIETRPWSTDYRGPLAIHSAKGVARDIDLEAWWDGNAHARAALAPHGVVSYADVLSLPRGVIIAASRLVRVERITECNAPDYPERAFGDYTPGRYAWHLADVVALPQPIPCRGALGLWAAPDEVVALLGGQRLAPLEQAY